MSLFWMLRTHPGPFPLPCRPNFGFQKRRIGPIQVRREDRRQNRLFLRSVLGLTIHPYLILIRVSGTIRIFLKKTDSWEHHLMGFKVLQGIIILIWLLNTASTYSSSFLWWVVCPLEILSLTFPAKCRIGRITSLSEKIHILPECSLQGISSSK